MNKFLLKINNKLIILIKHHETCAKHWQKGFCL